jgi:hypothetical protein
MDVRILPFDAALEEQRRHHAEWMAKAAELRAAVREAFAKRPLSDADPSWQP